MWTKLVADILGAILSRLLTRKDLKDKARLEVENAVIKLANTVLERKPELTPHLRVRDSAGTIRLPGEYTCPECGNEDVDLRSQCGRCGDLVHWTVG